MPVVKSMTFIISINNGEMQVQSDHQGTKQDVAIDGSSITGKQWKLDLEGLQEGKHLGNGCLNADIQPKVHGSVQESYKPTYFQAPCKVRHHFFNYLLLSIEEGFTQFVHRHMKERLESADWNTNQTMVKQHDVSYAGSNALPALPWDQPDHLEVKHWLELIEKLSLPTDAYNYPEEEYGYMPRGTILGFAVNLRDALFHSEISVSMTLLRYIMRIPRILKDEKRASQIEQVYKVVSNDPSVKEQTKSTVNKLLYPVLKPCKTLLQVHARILELLGESCFKFAKREDPMVLRDWEDCEYADMRSWRTVWCDYYKQEINKPGEILDLDGQLLAYDSFRCQAFRTAVELRNDVAHRNPLTEWNLRDYAYNGIFLAILLGDREQAIEIEIVAEKWLTQKSRPQILRRLRDYYINNPVPGDQPWELKRQESIDNVFYRAGIEVYLAEAIDEPKRDSFTLETDTTPLQLGNQDTVPVPALTKLIQGPNEPLEDSDQESSKPCSLGAHSQTLNTRTSISEGLNEILSKEHSDYQFSCDLSNESPPQEALLTRESMSEKLSPESAKHEEQEGRFGSLEVSLPQNLSRVTLSVPTGPGSFESKAVFVRFVESASMHSILKMEIPESEKPPPAKNDWIADQNSNWDKVPEPEQKQPETDSQPEDDDWDQDHCFNQKNAIEEGNETYQDDTVDQDADSNQVYEQGSSQAEDPETDSDDEADDWQDEGPTANEEEDDNIEALRLVKTALKQVSRALSSAKKHKNGSLDEGKYEDDGKTPLFAEKKNEFRNMTVTITLN